MTASVKRSACLSGGKLNGPGGKCQRIVIFGGKPRGGAGEMSPPRGPGVGLSERSTRPRLLCPVQSSVPHAVFTE
ncbi:hypothetical protein QTP88_003762 [Uroleucon formosanum]